MKAAFMHKVASKLTTVLLHPHYHAWNFPRNRCPVCRRRTVFLCDESADRWIRRCIWCRSTPKYRAISLVSERHLGRSMEDLLAHGGSIYELSTTSPIFRKLHGKPGYVASGYFSDKPFGVEIRKGVWNQDLQRLSFPSGTFDLVVSSETMEHVRRPWEGFNEIWRVLKPGGAHVFTIPYAADRPTRSRVDTSDDTNRHVLPPLYHRDPYRIEDSLVYTDFGHDLGDLLLPLGFHTDLVPLREPEADVQDDLAPVRVFVSVKRERVRGDS